MTGFVYNDTAYLREMADQDATHREEQRECDKKKQIELLRAMRRGEIKLLQALELLQVDGRNYLLEIIMEMKSELRRPQLDFSPPGSLTLSALATDWLTQWCKEHQAEKTTLQQRVPRSPKHKAVVNLMRLCTILAQPMSAYNPDNPPDLDRMFQHPGVDLAHTLAEQETSSLRARKAKSNQFSVTKVSAYVSHPHPCLILVDANIRESSLDGLSAISVFSSTLATSLMQAYPDTAVVVHFFCGMHSSRNGAWYGPTGLVRSLIMQLIMKLDAKDPEMSTWNLDFIKDRGFFMNLEQHSLSDLCYALHGLLYEFPPDTQIYCLIDSISCFDIGSLLKDLSTVMEQLRTIISDPNLVPIFKVLLTNPGESTRAIKNMTLFKEDPTRLVSLSGHNLVPGQISGRMVDDHLLRAPSPMRERTSSQFRHSRTPSPAVSASRRIEY